MSFQTQSKLLSGGTLGKPWVFEQLSGDRTRIELRGYAAPFGRPRQRPVISEEIVARHQTTRYPGYDGKPTRHFFGTNYTDSVAELRGRWTDKDLGAGGVERLIAAWTQFIKDQRQCQIHWSSIVSFTGFVEKLHIGRESATEVTWTLHLLIDSKDLLEQREAAVDLPQKTVTATLSDVDFVMYDGIGTLPSRLPSLDAVTGDLVDQVDDLVAGMNQSGALIVRLGNTINNVFEASFNELERLRAGSRQFRTALIRLSDTVDSIGDNAILFARQAEDDLAWLFFQRSTAVQRKHVLASLADMDDTLDVVQHGRAGSSYVARGGDSWESISTQFFGGPSGADSIRAANGIRYAQAPVAGNTYQIPANAF